MPAALAACGQRVLFAHLFRNCLGFVTLPGQPPKLMNQAGPCAIRVQYYRKANQELRLVTTRTRWEFDLTSAGLAAGQGWSGWKY